MCFEHESVWVTDWIFIRLCVNMRVCHVYLKDFNIKNKTGAHYEVSSFRNANQGSH